MSKFSYLVKYIVYSLKYAFFVEYFLAKISLVLKRTELATVTVLLKRRRTWFKFHFDKT